MSYITVFYAGMVHSEMDKPMAGFTIDLPDGVYLYFDRLQKPGPKSVFDRWGWYRKDLTPVLLEDVPKELRVLQLILNH